MARIAYDKEPEMASGPSVSVFFFWCDKEIRLKMSPGGVINQDDYSLGTKI